MKKADVRLHGTDPAAGEDPLNVHTSPGRFELPTFRLGGGRSILLSYGDNQAFLKHDDYITGDRCFQRKNEISPAVFRTCRTADGR